MRKTRSRLYGRIASHRNKDSIILYRSMHTYANIVHRHANAILVRLVSELFQFSIYYLHIKRKASYTCRMYRVQPQQTATGMHASAFLIHTLTYHHIIKRVTVGNVRNICVCVFWRCAAVYWGNLVADKLPLPFFSAKADFRFETPFQVVGYPLLFSPRCINISQNTNMLTHRQQHYITRNTHTHMPSTLCTHITRLKPITNTRTHRVWPHIIIGY